MSEMFYVTLRYRIKIFKSMSEVELYLIQDGDNCTIYTLQFLRDTENEFEKFISKFKESAEYSED